MDPIFESNYTPLYARPPPPAIVPPPGRWRQPDYQEPSFGVVGTLGGGGLPPSYQLHRRTVSDEDAPAASSYQQQQQQHHYQQTHQPYREVTIPHRHVFHGGSAQVQGLHFCGDLAPSDEESHDGFERQARKLVPNYNKKKKKDRPLVTETVQTIHVVFDEPPEHVVPSTRQASSNQQQHHNKPPGEPSPRPKRLRGSSRSSSLRSNSPNSVFDFSALTQCMALDAASLVLPPIPRRKSSSSSAVRSELIKLKRELGRYKRAEAAQKTQASSAVKKSCLKKESPPSPPSHSKSRMMRKSVRFARTLVTKVMKRPWTKPEDIERLYFQPEELEEIEMDRETVQGDQFECVYKKNRTVAVSYKNRKAQLDESGEDDDEKCHRRIVFTASDLSALEAA